MALKSQVIIAALALSISFGVVAKPESTWGPPYWTPSKKLVGKLEHQIKSLENHLQMPTAPGDRPEAVARYARYFSGATYDGRKVIVGEMVLPGIFAGPAGTYIVSRDDLPVVADGACGVIWLLYEPRTGKVVSILCNPVR